MAALALLALPSAGGCGETSGLLTVSATVQATCAVTATSDARTVRSSGVRAPAVRCDTATPYQASVMRADAALSHEPAADRREVGALTNAGAPTAMLVVTY